MNRIKELRIEKGLTQSQLAELLGVNQTAAGKYERGELEPNFSTLIKLSQIFEVSIDFLIGHSDDLGVISISPHKEKAAELSPDELHLLEVFRGLNTKNRIHVTSYAEIRLEEQAVQGSLSFKHKQQ